MASTIHSLQAEIQAACDELGRQMDEEYRLNRDIGQSLAELLAIGLSRQDTETTNSIATELATMIQIHGEGEITVQDVLAKLNEAQSAETTNPSDYHTALSEILEMAKRANSHKTAAITELKRMQSRVQELLDAAKPKA